MNTETTEAPEHAMCREHTDEELFAELRAWLRAHGDYNVTIDLWALYGCYRIAVTHLGREVWSDQGDNLDKRLRNALEYVRGLEVT